MQSSILIAYIDCPGLTVKIVHSKKETCELLGYYGFVRWPTWRKLSFTCFPICLGVHNDKLWTQFTYSSAFEDGHQTSKVLQVQSVAGPPHLRVILRALHGTVQTLVSRCWVAHKITHVVGIWDGGLEEKTWGCSVVRNLMSLLPQQFYSEVRRWHLWQHWYASSTFPGTSSHLFLWV